MKPVPTINRALGLAGPILWLIYAVGHVAGVAPAFLWIRHAVLSHDALYMFVAVTLSVAFVFPISLLVAWALIVRAIPKPLPGPIDSVPKALVNMLLTATYMFARTSASRLPYSALPFPGMWFYWLAGCKIHMSAMISTPDCLPDPHLVEIGANSTIGQGAVLSGHFRPNSDVAVLGPIVVGKDVLVGGYALVCPDVVIGDGAVVQANAVVTAGTVIGAREVWGGQPARKLRTRAVESAGAGARPGASSALAGEHEDPCPVPQLRSVS